MPVPVDAIRNRMLHTLEYCLACTKIRRRDHFSTTSEPAVVHAEALQSSSPRPKTASSLTPSRILKDRLTLRTRERAKSRASTKSRPSTTSGNGKIVIGGPVDFRVVDSFRQRSDTSNLRPELPYLNRVITSFDEFAKNGFDRILYPPRQDSLTSSPKSSYSIPRKPLRNKSSTFSISTSAALSDFERERMPSPPPNLRIYAAHAREPFQRSPPSPKTPTAMYNPVTPPRTPRTPRSRAASLMKELPPTPTMSDRHSPKSRRSPGKPATPPLTVLQRRHTEKTRNVAAAMNEVENLDARLRALESMIDKRMADYQQARPKTATGATSAVPTSKPVKAVSPPGLSSYSLIPPTIKNTKSFAKHSVNAQPRPSHRRSWTVAPMSRDAPTPAIPPKSKARFTPSPTPLGISTTPLPPSLRPIPPMEGASAIYESFPRPPTPKLTPSSLMSQPESMPAGPRTPSPPMRPSPAPPVVAQARRSRSPSPELPPNLPLPPLNPGKRPAPVQQVEAWILRSPKTAVVTRSVADAHRLRHKPKEFYNRRSGIWGSKDGLERTESDKKRGLESGFLTITESPEGGVSRSGTGTSNGSSAGRREDFPAFQQEIADRVSLSLDREERGNWWVSAREMLGESIDSGADRRESYDLEGAFAGVERAVGVAY